MDKPLERPIPSRTVPIHWRLKISKSTLVAWAIVLVFLSAWEAWVHISNIKPYLLPAPSRVFANLGTYPQDYLHAAGITLGESLAGLLLGVLCGAVIAAPMVAIAPLLTIWLGFGVLPKIIITGLLTFFPVLGNVLTGFQRPDPALLDLFRSWHASRWQIFLHLRLPSAAPYLFAALKISAPLALIGAVVAEWTGASGGLGRTMWMAYTNLNLPSLFAAIFILAGAGVSLYGLLSWAERKAIFWQPDQRQ
jgi:ABC-type nitrate/sulfonate/bicarbonate transport system permease component